MERYVAFLEALGPDGWRGLMCCVLVIGIAARVVQKARNRGRR